MRSHRGTRVELLRSRCPARRRELGCAFGSPPFREIWGPERNAPLFLTFSKGKRRLDADAQESAEIQTSAERAARGESGAIQIRLEIHASSQDDGNRHAMDRFP